MLFPVNSSLGLHIAESLSAEDFDLMHVRRVEEGKSLRVPGTNPFFFDNDALQGNRFLELLETCDGFLLPGVQR